MKTTPPARPSSPPSRSRTLIPPAWRRRVARPGRLSIPTPPGPRRGWWGLPLLREMGQDYLAFLARLHAHGDITLMRIGREWAYDVFSAELVRAVLVDNAEHLVRWEHGLDVFEQVFGQSVLTTEGATWQRQRRMLQPAFTPRRVAGYAALMREAADEALAAALPAGCASGTVPMDQLFTRMTMDAILRTLFSARGPSEVGDAIEAMQTLSDAALREMLTPILLPDWLPHPGRRRKQAALATLHGLVHRHIEARRASGDTAASDLLAMLLALRDEETGEGLSGAELFDQCMVTFQAGHDTGSTALLWWSWLMATHPEAAGRAREEVDRALGGRPPEPDDLPALPWLTASLKETLRLYPPISALLTRRTTQAITVGGWQIPQGAMVRISPWIVQRDARAFPEPDAFRPERFLPDAPPPPRGAWIPFGVGPRVCIGQHFAMLEMTLMAALLLQRYTLSLPPGALPGGVPELKVTLRPKDRVILQLTRRGSPSPSL